MSSDYYNDDPTWVEYFKLIPNIRLDSKKKKIIKDFGEYGYARPFHTWDLTFMELQNICFNERITLLLFQLNMKYKNNGRLSLGIDDLLKREASIERISSGSNCLDEVLPGGGLETQSIYEIVSRNGQGKTQMCFTIAANTMRMKKQGGLNRSVLWIDSQRDFSTSRFLEVTKDITRDRMRSNFHYSLINDLDELENILDNTNRNMWIKIGCLVIDSLILSVKLQYPIVEGYSTNEVRKKEHLIRIFRKLRILSKRYNLMVVFTSTLQNSRFYERHLPESDMELQNGADLRILIGIASSADRRKFRIGDELILLRASLVNSNRIEDRKGYFMIDEGGICDPKELKIKKKL